MTEGIWVVPSPDSEYVALSGTSDDGRLLRKRILPMNKSFVHPGNHKAKIFVDKAMAESLIKNFKAGVCDIVQVPIVNQDNQHTEDPRDNAGRVTGLDYDETGVYATIKASKFAEDFGKTILGASAFLHLNYMDSATGSRVGPTLLHVAATNRPHINGLGEFEDVLRASADNLSDKEVILSEEVPEDAPTGSEDEASPEESNPTDESVINMTKEDALAFLKDNPDVARDFLKDSEGVDVAALQGEADKAAELSAQLDTVNEQLALSGDKIENIEDLTNAVVALTNSNKTLEDSVEELKLSNATYAKRDAENEVEGLIRAGKVLPAQKDVMVKLSMSDRETFDALVPENPIVKLSEDGFAPHEVPNAVDHSEAIKHARELAASLSNRKN